MSRLTILVVRPNQAPKAETINNTLEAMQGIVGGHIECVSFQEYNLFCNEEGKLKGLPPNRYIQRLQDTIVGNFFLTGGVDDEGEVISLTSAEIQYLSDVFKNTLVQ